MRQPMLLLLLFLLFIQLSRSQEFCGEKECCESCCLDMTFAAGFNLDSTFNTVCADQCVSTTQDVGCNVGASRACEAGQSFFNDSIPTVDFNRNEVQFSACCLSDGVLKTGSFEAAAETFCFPPAPTDNPSQSPTSSPSESPSKSPTSSPSQSPTSSPTENPSRFLTDNPTSAPTKFATSSPETVITESTNNEQFPVGAILGSVSGLLALCGIVAFFILKRRKDEPSQTDHTEKNNSPPPIEAKDPFFSLPLPYQASNSNHSKSVGATVEVLGSQQKDFAHSSGTKPHGESNPFNNPDFIAAAVNDTTDVHESFPTGVRLTSGMSISTVKVGEDDQKREAKRFHPKPGPTTISNQKPNKEFEKPKERDLSLSDFVMKTPGESNLQQNRKKLNRKKPTPPSDLPPPVSVPTKKRNTPENLIAGEKPLTAVFDEEAVKEAGLKREDFMKAPLKRRKAKEIEETKILQLPTPIAQKARNKSMQKSKAEEPEPELTLDDFMVQPEEKDKSLTDFIVTNPGSNRSGEAEARPTSAYLTSALQNPFRLSIFRPSTEYVQNQKNAKEKNAKKPFKGLQVSSKPNESSKNEEDGELRDDEL